MKRILLLVAIVLFLSAGCSSVGKVLSTPPDKAKESLDQICGNAFGSAGENNTNFDFWRGGFAGAHVDWREKLTAQQLKDVEDFMLFCKKPVEQRTAFEYGYETGVFVRTIKDLLPLDVLGIAAKNLK